ncbi:MAG TPA: DUF2334 domain-containing protein [Euryarchaeota archaeon]|nr:DUF2334 domain-containing protein [Euryarchaeota archaeon]
MDRLLRGGGGDLSEGALGNVEWLLGRHPDLKATLFVTANWRETSGRPTRKILASIPYVRDRVYLAGRWPRDRMRLDRHPSFVEYLNSLERVEVAYHGLYHSHKGPKIFMEFQERDRETLERNLDEMVDIFKKAGLRSYPGICPPGWNAPPPLLEALSEKGFRYVASARDLFTPVEREALTNMSGLKGLPLIRPHVLEGGLVHFPSNFQATSHIERAESILELGGLLAVKAHIVKLAFGRMSLDGLDSIYSNYLDMVFSRIEREYGGRVWWTSMGKIADRILATSSDRPVGGGERP